MPIVTKNINTVYEVKGLTPAVLNIVTVFEIGNNPVPALSASNDTAATLASSGVVFTTSNTFVMPQARNLKYSCSYTGASTNGLSAGTLYIWGKDLQGRAMTESVALTSLAVATSLNGTKRFVDTCTYTIGGYGEYSTYSSKSASDSVTFQIGVGPVFGLPADIKQGYNTWFWRTGSAGTASSSGIGAFLRVVRTAQGSSALTGNLAQTTYTATDQFQLVSGNAVQGGGGLSVVSTALLTSASSHSQNMGFRVHWKLNG